MENLSNLDFALPESVKASFRALAHGGLTTEYLFLTCYVDYTASEYVLGAGPTTLTVAYDHMAQTRSYALYRRAHTAGEFGKAALVSESAYRALLDQAVWDAEAALRKIVEGRQSVVFLAPMGAHHAIAIEAWQVVAQWDVQTVEGVVNAVRYGAHAGDPEHTQTLAKLKSRVTTAAARDTFATKRIANASGLQKYYRDIGAYGDITPDDGKTETFTPAQPPPVQPCTNGTVVPDPTNANNRDLVRDCRLLFAAKDTLAGTATLNWDGGRALTAWDGITVAGTPRRVTGLAPTGSLSGTLPPRLGELAALTVLNLSNKTLTGEIPVELGRLTKLATLRLAGNTFTGCIPIALQAVASHDLASLNLLYCRPPAPTGLSTSDAKETGITLSWSAVTNASKYRVEYRLGEAGEWTVDNETLTGASHTLDKLKCGSAHRFRVSAYGSGTVYAAAWSVPSAPLEASTTACTGPAFGAETYAFQVYEEAKIGATVGQVTATDPNDTALTYTITAGNGAGRFAIDEDSGEITVAAALDHDTTPSYTLTVRVSDGKQTDEAKVTIEVTDEPVSIDYDLDNDGLVEVKSLAQLNAIRWDLDGNGASSEAGYAAAFPDALPSMGCPTTGCKGYELARNLDFDTNGSGAADADDTYWNNGYGWAPIGDNRGEYSATFDGNGRTIANLFINRRLGAGVALFEAAGPSSVIRRVRLRNVSVTGGTAVAALVGYSKGTVHASAASGRVQGYQRFAGGLVGWHTGTVSASTVSGTVQGKESVGGVVGLNLGGTVAASYATGPVTGATYTGGLVGSSSGTITASYATGAVTGTTDTGGLVGENDYRVTASYWDTATSGKSSSGGGTGKTTSELQTPTAATGIYANWNVDLTGDGTGDDPWDFGTASQYPVLRADINGDGTATWREFGTQRGVPGAPTIGSLAWKSAEGGRLQLVVSWSAPSWDGGSPVTSYDVRYIAVGADKALPANWTLLEGAWSSGSLEYAITGLQPGRRVVQVRGVNANGKGRWSADATLTGNSPPSFTEASPTRTVAENTAAEAALGKPVSATDPEGDALTYRLTGTDAASFAIDESTGQLKTSAPLNFETKSSYLVSVEVSDGNGTATVAVTITVTDANDPPLAQADTATTKESTAVTIAVLDNDSDEDAGATIKVAAVTQPANGSVALSAAGVATYTPNAGFHGSDSFTYTLSDGSHSVVGAVTVTVNAVCSNGTAVPNPSDKPGLVRDCTILLAVKDTLRGTATLNWSESIPVSTWQGVTLTESADGVLYLKLSQLGLGGSLPAQLGNLSALKRLNLEQNRLTGGIPGGLEDLTNLVRLNLGRNRLSGSIPQGLGSLSNLKTLNLRNNRLTGAIPIQLGSLTGLTELNLSGNRLDGAIPTQFGSLTKLTDLRLNGNRLAGAIPAALGSLTRLKQLHLNGNDLSGCIPSELGSLTSLTRLRLNGNSFTGSIPAAIRNFGLTNPTAAALRQDLNLPWSDAPGAPPCGPAGIAGTPAITSAPSTGSAYFTGDKITVDVTFNKAVTVSGTPQLALQVGSAERQADYASGSTTKTLRFSYTVAADDTDENGISIGANKLSLNSGTIRDAENSDANLSHSALADQSGHKVNPAPVVTLHLSKTAIPEAGGATVVTATLDRSARSDITVTVTAAPGPAAAATDYELSANTVLSIAANATTSTGTVTITAVNNDVDTPDKTVTVSGAVSTGSATAPGDVILTISDDDTAGVSAYPSRRYVSEGYSTSYSVVLLSQPTGDVTVTPQSNNAAVTVSAPLTFTTENWDAAQKVVATAVEDDNVVGETVRITNTASGGGYDDAPGWTIIVYVTDNDRSVLLSPDTVTVAEGGTASYTVELNVQPTDTVKVTPRSLDTDTVTVPDTTLSFTTTNWDEPQTVTVTAKEDDDGDDESVEIVHAVTGGGYDGQSAVPRVTVAVTDDDTAPAKPTGFTATAGDAAVTLSWSDPNDATITDWQYRQKTGTGEYGAWTQTTGRTTSNSTITFTVSSLNNGQAYTFQVRAVNAVGGGAESDAAAATPAAKPKATLKLSPASIGENGGTATVTAALDKPSNVETTLTVSTSPTDGFKLSGSTLTIAANATASTDSLTLTAVDDNVDAPDKNVTVSGTVNHAGVTAPDNVTLTITDDDPTPSVTLQLSETSISEDGGTTVVSATMDYASSEETTITLTAAPDHFNLSATTLTIPAGKTESAGTVTLTAVDNDADAPDKTVDVAATATNARAVNAPASVTLTITDDDSPEAYLPPQH